MIRTTTSAGVCGFRTTATAGSDDMQMVSLEIASDCDKIRGLTKALKQPIHAYREIRDGSRGGAERGTRPPNGLLRRLRRLRRAERHLLAYKERLHVEGRSPSGLPA